MRKDDAIRHFGGAQEVAGVCGISPSAVYQWGDVVPLLSALKLAEASGGTLVVDRDLYSANGTAVRKGSNPDVAAAQG